MSGYSRRMTSEIKVGEIAIGGNNPVRIQTMANTDTNNIETSVAQAIRCINAGTELLRYTTQGNKEAENLNVIHGRLIAQGFSVPLVADIHFNPKVAETAAGYVEKIRINPGNFVPGKKGTYTDEEWDEELESIRRKLIPILNICKQHGTAIRIGVNHGSLSPRIMSRYGNTPAGLAESCMEFIELCEQENFTNLILSVKASNTMVMIHAVRLLVEKMNRTEKKYPLHLGVTEAGSDDEGRIKSAVGIGTLLGEGIGDTIRVSLSEAPEAEIPVARKLVDYIALRAGGADIPQLSYAPKTEFSRRRTIAVDKIGGNNVPVVIADSLSSDDSLAPDYKSESTPYYIETDLKGINNTLIEELKRDNDKFVLLYSNHNNPTGEIRAAIDLMDSHSLTNPVIVKRTYQTDDIETFQIQAAADLGPLLIDGLIDGIYIQSSSRQITPDDILTTSFGILQASRARISKTEYISCPSCGRTKFNLPEVVRQVKAATSKYTGLKIAVMGCIVNGPGEMADADFGYIGAGQDRISLYKGHECIEKNIPESDAIPRLIELIESEYKGNKCCKL